LRVGGIRRRRRCDKTCDDGCESDFATRHEHPYGSESGWFGPMIEAASDGVFTAGAGNDN
jgi:hypothetical protein